MPEAVIVATGRTTIGRANKGSLTECRPDDLSALVIGAVLQKLPQLDPAEVEDAARRSALVEDVVVVGLAAEAPAWNATSRTDNICQPIAPKRSRATRAR